MLYQYQWDGKKYYDLCEYGQETASSVIGIDGISQEELMGIVLDILPYLTYEQRTKLSVEMYAHEMDGER